MKIQHLKAATEDFFNLYWPNSAESKPYWSEVWDFISERPNNVLRGCYAFFNANGSLVYIGCAVSSNGLGGRLNDYIKKNRSSDTPKYIMRDKWLEVKGIRTLGLNEDHYHLAAALEIYLIKNLQPTRNNSHK